VSGAPKKTIWDLEPHTRAKHEVLERYLQAWLPILSQAGFSQVLYIDGFAGPGRYSQGEPGSPFLALRAALGQRKPLQADVQFLFVEKDSKRREVLKSIIEEIPTPANFHVRVAQEATFEEAYAELRTLNGAGLPLPPTFAFVDPFGWAGVPFNIVAQILASPSCEVLVTFMYEEINRFLAHPDQVANFDAFFGTAQWRVCVQVEDSKARQRCLHDLYRDQLQKNAKHVRSFEMRNRKDATDYFLFYATNNGKGLRRMKEAMWRVDESGEFTFSDATDARQLVIFEARPRLDVLREAIVGKFSGQTVTVNDVETFVVECTSFRETHYKKILKALESESPPGIHVIDPPVSRRPGTYADLSMRIRFNTNRPSNG
jgi:three-Cys-motif partner protein